jgi:hypothetical protein
MQGFVDDRGGFARAQHRRADDGKETVIGKQRTGGSGLGPAVFIQGNVDRTLAQTTGIILRLAVAQEPEGGLRKAQLEGLSQAFIGERALYGGAAQHAFEMGSDCRR